MMERFTNPRHPPGLVHYKTGISYAFLIIKFDYIYTGLKGWRLNAVDIAYHLPAALVFSKHSILYFQVMAMICQSPLRYHRQQILWDVETVHYKCQ